MTQKELEEYVKSEIDKIDKRMNYIKKMDRVMMIVLGTTLFIKLITLIG